MLDQKGSLIMFYESLHPLYAGVKWSVIASQTGYNEDTFRQQFSALRGGRREALPKKMADRLQAALPYIHGEIPLHSYSNQLFDAICKLRAREESARALFRDSKSRSTEEIQNLWKKAKSHLADMFCAAVVSQAMKTAESNDDLSDDERTLVYVGGAILHSICIVWEDAAQAMMRCVDDATADDTLDLVGFGFEAETIVDVSETALRLYEFAQQDLLTLLRNQRGSLRAISSSILETEAQEGAAEEKRRLGKRLAEGTRRLELLQQDNAVLGLNMASMSSHVDDWIGNQYIEFSGVSKCEAEKRLQRLSGHSRLALKLAVPLMQRFRRHPLVARNLAYMAIQYNDADVAISAEGHLGDLLGVEPHSVWSMPIAGRVPLSEEKDLAASFTAGRPTLLLS